MVGLNATEATNKSSACPASPAMIRFGRAICGDLQQAERREWWLANGLGAYAGGTMAGSLTRRYHGLLIALAEPPLGALHQSLERRRGEPGRSRPSRSLLSRRRHPGLGVRHRAHPHRGARLAR